MSRCCIQEALPDGRIVPFCAYNTLYRFAPGQRPVPGQVLPDAGHQPIQAPQPVQVGRHPDAAPAAATTPTPATADTTDADTATAATTDASPPPNRHTAR